jgi:hypothetical protein
MPVLISSVDGNPPATYPNEEEATHVQLVGGPAVLLQDEKVTYVDADNADPIEIRSDIPFDVFPIASVRVVAYGEDELKTEKKSAPAKSSKSASKSKSATTSKKS